MRDTYKRMQERCVVLLKERETNPEAVGQQVETIQLQSIDPNFELHVNIPMPGTNDEDEMKARAVFESLPPGLQRALESGSLERVNEVLAKMSVSEAEEVVEKLSSHNMLSLEEGVIDNQTEEGRKRLEEIKRQAAEDAAVDEAGGKASEEATSEWKAAGGKE